MKPQLCFFLENLILFQLLNVVGKLIIGMETKSFTDIMRPGLNIVMIG